MVGTTTRSPADPAVGLGASRLAVAAAFATQGLVFISLTTRLPTVRTLWHIAPLGLSVLLLMMVLLAGVGSVLTETLARRWDSAVLLRSALLLMGVLAVPGFALAPAFGVFVAALAVYGVALGMVDATTNMQAVAVEHRIGRPILPSFHGAWTLGGIVGSALTLATARLDLDWAAVLGLVPVLASTGPLLRRVGDPRASGPRVQVPWRPIVLVGLAMVLFYMVDTAAFTWGPTYLDDVFPTPAGLVALATFPYLLASAAMRLAGDALVARFGSLVVLRAGAVLACASLAVVVAATSWPLAVVGFTGAGAGVAVVAPLSFSAAARIAGGSGLSDAERHARVDEVIGRFNQFNYAGSLVGAVLTGLVGANNLRIGFAVPMVLVLGIVPLARSFVRD